MLLEGSVYIVRNCNPESLSNLESLGTLESTRGEIRHIATVLAGLSIPKLDMWQKSKQMPSAGLCLLKASR